VISPGPLLSTAVVAAATKTPHAPKGGEGVKSGPIGLAVILVLCVAVYFLFKSMSKHLRKVREEFPVHADDGPAAPGSTAPPPDQSVAPPAAQPTDQRAEVPPKSESS
jgi:hypothetical protein